MSSVIEHPACRRGPAGGNGSGVPVVLVDGGRRQSPGSQHSGLTPWPLLLPPAPLPDSGAGSASPEIRNGTFVPAALQQLLAQPQKSLLAPMPCEYAQAVLKMGLISSM